MLRESFVKINAMKPTSYNFRIYCQWLVKICWHIITYGW